MLTSPRSVLPLPDSAWRYGTAVALLAVLALPAPSPADIVRGTIHFTTFRDPDVSPNRAGVHKADFAYNRTTSFTFGPITTIATFDPTQGGADGIVFTSNGFLAVGGQGNVVFKVDPNKNNSFTSVNAGGTAAFHMMTAPNGTIYSSGIPGTPASYPADLSRGGTAHPLTGSDTAIDTIAWSDAQHAFYTSSGAGGFGSFGTIDLTTFRTTRVHSNLAAAHGMAFDPYTGDLILFGDDHITQIDPDTLAIVSDLSTSGGAINGINFNFDQGTVDGLGHIYAASNSGHLLFLDVTNSRRVGSPDFLAAPRLAAQLDDVAPLIGRVEIIPEPSGLALLVVGLGTCLVWRRRKMKP